MHGFDTGLGPAAKKNNWDQLERLFNKLGIPVPKEVAHDVLSMKPDAAHLLLSIIYSNEIRLGYGYFNFFYITDFLL